MTSVRSFINQKLSEFAFFIISWALTLATFVPLAFACYLLARLAYLLISPLVSENNFLPSDVLRTSILLLVSVLAFIFGLYLNHIYSKGMLKKLAESEDERVESAITQLWMHPMDRESEEEIPFALYLRSFGKKGYFGYTRLRSLSDIYHRVQLGTDFETMFMMALVEAGLTTIKIGVDLDASSEELVYKGINIPSSDNIWANHFDNLAWQAPIIFIVPGSSNGILAELFHILSIEELLIKTMIVFPPAKDDIEANREVAQGLGFGGDDIDRIKFCGENVRIIHAYELVDMLKEARADTSNYFPSDIQELQRPFRCLYQFGTPSEERTRNLMRMMATVAGNRYPSGAFSFMYDFALQMEAELPSLFYPEPVSGSSNDDT